MTPRAPYGIVPPLACELLNHFAFFWRPRWAPSRARSRLPSRIVASRCGGARSMSHFSTRARARMASRGAHVPGTDGSDHAFRQRVVDRYQNYATARRRAKVLLRAHALVAMAFAMCTALGAFATRGMRLGATFDSRTTATLMAGVMACALAAHGARAVDDKRGTGGTRTCALALGALGAAHGAFGTYARWVGIDEIGSPAWMWAELTSMAIGKALGATWVSPGMCYPACVNAETLAEMFMIGTPLGVYAMCVGIDSHHGRKNK